MSIDRASFRPLAGAIIGATLAGLVCGTVARRQHHRAARLHRVLVDLLLNALSAGDRTTERHCRRVADLADALLSESHATGVNHATARLAALLHDLGKIDDFFFAILHSNEPLSAEERRKIEQHPRRSAGMLQPLEAVHPGITRIIEAHHECWDGRGYPSGLAGEEIPLEARFISVADVFDALTQPRSYREPLSLEKAFAELQKGAGSRFDPNVLEMLDSPAVRERWREIVERGRKVEEEAANL